MTTGVETLAGSQPTPEPPARGSDRYKWVALSNTTLGLLMAMINSSIVLIAMPDIFRGIHLNPLTPGNTSYLLWMLMGFNVVTAVLVVSLGRLGDMFGRARMFNLGFATFTAFSIVLSVTWMHGTAAALYLILLRVGQAVGASMLMANSSCQRSLRSPRWRSRDFPADGHGKSPRTATGCPQGRRGNSPWTARFSPPGVRPGAPLLCRRGRPRGGWIRRR
jgi:hypothetical protein